MARHFTITVYSLIIGLKLTAALHDTNRIPAMLARIIIKQKVYFEYKDSIEELILFLLSL